MSEKRQQPTPESVEGFNSLGDKLRQAGIENGANAETVEVDKKVETPAVVKTAQATPEASLTKVPKSAELNPEERKIIRDFLKTQIGEVGLSSGKFSLEDLQELDTDDKLLKHYTFFQTLESILPASSFESKTESAPEPVTPAKTEPASIELAKTELPSAPLEPVELKTTNPKTETVKTGSVESEQTVKEPTIAEIKNFLIKHDGREQYMFRGVPNATLKAEYQKVKSAVKAKGNLDQIKNDRDPLRQQQKPLRSAPEQSKQPEQNDATAKPKGAEKWEAPTYEYSTKVTGTSKGVIRQIPAGWDDIRPVMKEKLKEPEVDAWSDVGRLESDIQNKYGVRVIRGGKTPQESTAALNALAETLEVMPKEKITGRAIAIQALGIEHTDGTLDINPSWSADQIADYMTKKLDLNVDKPDKISKSKVGGVAATVAGAAASGSVFKNSFKQPKVTYDETGQADLPGLNSESTLKRAGILEKDSVEHAPDTATQNDNAPERGGLLEQSDEILKQDLESARVKYVAAKRAFDEFGALSHLRNKIKLGGESKQRVNEALEQAQADYEQARTAYVGASFEMHIHEQSQMRKARFEQYVTKNAGTMDKARGLWNKLGEASYFEYRKNRGKEIQNRAGAALAKAANLRTAISLGLLGTGLYAGATTAGAGVLLARRAYGGLGSTMGSKSIFEQLRMARHNKPLTSEQLSNLATVEDVERQIGIFEARAMLSGADEESLLNNRDFQTLLAKQENLLASRAAESAGGANQVIRDSHETSEQAFTKAQKSERRGRAATTAAAVAVGAAVGGGAAAKAANYFAGAESAPVPNAGGKSPEFSAPLYDNIEPVNPDSINKTELTFHGKGTGASVEVVGKDAYVTAGNRGIEGALQDLKRADPEKYRSMIDSIKSQYPGTQAKDSTLIHRAVKKLAEQNGFTVDGGAKDLSRIDFAKVVLSPGADGNIELKLDKSTLDFMAESPNAGSAAAAAPESGNEVQIENKAPVIDTLRVSNTESAPEVVDTLRVSEVAPDQKIGPEQIEVEKLDFKNLFPNGEQPDSIAGAASEVTESRIQNIYESALTESDKYPKTSDALKHLLKDDYAAFMKDKIRLDARVVNRLQKFPVSEFMQEYAHSKELPPKQLVELRGLADSINELLVRSTDSQRTAIRSGTIRQLLIRLASERMNK